MSDYNPLVSIITPSYNQAEFISKTIESVLHQTYQNIEYIIIDGGSTDGTIEILKRYGNKIKWISQKDQGQSDAINKGFKLAKGEILAWLNSDDTYELNCVELAVEFFATHKDYGLVYGRGNIIDKNDVIIKEFEATIKPDIYLLIHFWDYILQPTTFFKKQALQEIGYLNHELHYCMDWDLWIRLFLNYKVGFIDAYLANSREYTQTKTASGGLKRLIEIARLMRKYTNKFFPLGLISYIGSTIEMALTNYKFFQNLGKFISIKSLNFCSKKIGLITNDGWIGKKYHITIQPLFKGVKLIFNPIVDYGFPFKISFYIDNMLTNEITISNTNDYHINLPLISNEITNYTVMCERIFIPNQLDKKNKDKRKLGIFIKNISFVE